MAPNRVACGHVLLDCHSTFLCLLHVPSTKQSLSDHSGWSLVNGIVLNWCMASDNAENLNLQLSIRKVIGKEPKTDRKVIPARYLI